MDNTQPELLTCAVCTMRDCLTPWYRRWMDEVGNDHREGRKRWEDASIIQALYERGMLKPGTRILGFGVGRECLPSLFAKYGCTVVATDQAMSPQAERDWLNTGQMGTCADDLYHPHIVDRETFDRLVTFEVCDMNAIPDKYIGQFDVVYNACSMDHLGTLEAGMIFFERSMECLRPGGWAVHTTEYNINNDGPTVEAGSTVFYRARDIVVMLERLQDRGYYVEPFDPTPGNLPEDSTIDYEPHQRPAHHLVLQAAGCIVSSVRLIAQMPAAATMITAILHGGPSDGKSVPLKTATPRILVSWIDQDREKRGLHGLRVSDYRRIDYQTDDNATHYRYEGET